VARRISFKKGTPGYAKRREIAEAIARKNPGIDMTTKFKEATAAVKKSTRRRR
jgi:hypothetical protein